MAKEVKFMDVGKGRTIEEFVSCFDMLKGKYIKIDDSEEILIMGIVDPNYNFAEERNYRLLKAVPLMSSIDNKPQDGYVGEFKTIRAIYTTE